MKKLLYEFIELVGNLLQQMPCILKSILLVGIC